MSQNPEDFEYVLPADAAPDQKPGKVHRRSLDHWLDKGFVVVDRNGAPTTSEPESEVPTPAAESTDVVPVTPVVTEDDATEAPTETPGVAPEGAPDNGTAADNADTTAPASETPRPTGRAGKGR